MTSELSRFSQRKGVLLPSLLTLGLGNCVWAITRFAEGRSSFPPVIAEHVGNFTLTALPLLGLSSWGPPIQKWGIDSNNKRLELFGKVLPILAVGLALLANIIVESQFLFRPSLLEENLGDMAMGLLGIIVALPLAEYYRKNLSLDRGIDPYPSRVKSNNNGFISEATQLPNSYL